jgi:hypothetical protein
MNISSAPAYNGSRFIKVMLDGDEASILTKELSSAVEVYPTLSPTGMFTLSMLLQHGNKQGGIEITYMNNGIREFIDDLEFKIRCFNRSPVTKLLIYHLQYFSIFGNFSKNLQEK